MSVSVRLIPDRRQQQRTGSTAGSWITTSRRWQLLRTDAGWQIAAYPSGRQDYYRHRAWAEASGLAAQRFATREQARRALNMALTVRRDQQPVPPDPDA